MLTAGAAYEERALTGVDAIFDHVSDVSLQGVEV
jgi:hypothetical protein